MIRGTLPKYFLVICCLVSAVPARAIDFVYSGTDCRIVYRFTPRTGTLNDLKVIYNNRFTFFPSYSGGITLFELAGSRLVPGEGKHTSQLLEESTSGGLYQARFRWSFEGQSFDFVLEMRLKGKTLTVGCSALASVQNVIQFGLDRSEGTPAPKVVVLPYGHNVLFTNGVFVSAVLDQQLSNSSSIEASDSVYSETSARFSETASYNPLTDGRRNNLNETVYLAVSPKIEETFCALSNPVSPYKGYLSDKIIVDLWRNSFDDYRADLESLAAMGLTGLFAIIHSWQKDGYDNGLPSTYPAGGIYGGDAALREVSLVCQRNRYLFALHTNYVDFYPDSDVWNPGDVALNPEGQWTKAWFSPVYDIQSYLLKPSKSTDYAGLYEPSIHAGYSTSASFIDVSSSVFPSAKVDYDARQAGAGKQQSTFLAYKDLFSYVRSVHQGPVAGEGVGYSSRIWAGYIDAVEADPRSPFQNREGSQVPSLVDYKLRLLNRLFVPHGAGYLERFYIVTPFNNEPENFERYRATELAFGNTGFLSNPFEREFPKIETLREYCFLKHLQPYYIDSQPVEINYGIQGELVSLSEALNRILPGVKNEDVDSALLDGLSLVKIRFDNGFVLFVNRSLSKPWDILVEKGLITLPPGGFLGYKGKEFAAFTAVIDGVKRYYIWPAEKSCRGDLSDYIRPPLNLAARKIRARSFFRIMEVNLVTWQPNPSNSDVAKYRIYSGEGSVRTFLAEVNAQTFQYRDFLVAAGSVVTYAVVAVNGEGREGEAAFVTLK
jgi:hypothetical protein